jgi:sugar (pentulose or hexulose) kinase
VAGLSFGTTVTANALSSRYREPLPLLPAYPAAVPHHYLLEVQQSRGFSLVSWFLQEFGHPEREQAQREGRSSERLLDDLLAQTPPLAHGLVTLPTFSPGVIYPGPEARGAMVGFGDVHGRAHLYRSLMEGLAFAMRFGVEQLERRLGRSFSALHVSGGGSRSPAVVQLVCDVLGRPCRQLATYEASALGAAINGAVGLNWYGSYREAVDQMVKMGETFVPDANNLVEYQQMYRQVYRKLYGQLRKNFQVMKQITGYPH